MNQLGFCTTRGRARYKDNGGKRLLTFPHPTDLTTVLGLAGYTCPPTFDCDIIAGSISQCPTNSFPFFDPNPLVLPSMMSDTSKNLTTPPPGPASIATVPGWRYRGCYTDSMTDRVLVGRFKRGPQITVQRCADSCGSLGFRYFGVEYSDEYVPCSWFHSMQLLLFLHVRLSEPDANVNQMLLWQYYRSDYEACQRQYVQQCLHGGF